MLLIGFLQQEVDSFRSIMLDMDADIVRMICCSRSMLRGSLQAALEVDAVPDYEQASTLSGCLFPLPCTPFRLRGAVQRSHRWARSAQSFCLA